MTIDWDFAQKIVLKSSSKSIARLTELFKDRCVELSPVGDPETWDRLERPKGYTAGQFKGSWGFSYNYSENTGYIFNPQPYGRRLEYGWSQQAPSGMVRITFGEFHGMLQRAADENKI